MMFAFALELVDDETLAPQLTNEKEKPSSDTPFGTPFAWSVPALSGTAVKLSVGQDFPSYVMEVAPDVRALFSCAA